MDTSSRVLDYFTSPGETLSTKTSTREGVLGVRARGDRKQSECDLSVKSKRACDSKVENGCFRALILKIVVKKGEFGLF
jgi:hypothetical protein